MASVNPKLLGALAVGALGVLCLFVLGREVMNEGALGESRNPNFGHPSSSQKGSGRGAKIDFNNVSEEQYYQGLKANRPDLSEKELRAKADHWWKVRTGQAQVTGN